MRIDALQISDETYIDNTKSQVQLNKKGIFMTKAQRTAAGIRHILLFIWILCLGLGLFWLFLIFLFKEGFLGVSLFGTPLYAILGPLYPIAEGFLEDTILSMVVLVWYVMLFFISQWFFLCPRHIWRFKVNSTSRPMKRAVMGAAFGATLLSVGFIYSLLDLVLCETFIEVEKSAKPIFYLILMIPILCWSLWAVILFVYGRRLDHTTWVSRVIRGLVTGSILEMILSIAIYTTRKDECYCAKGSYTGLVFGATVLLWTFGPGIFLLFYREKRKQEQLLSSNQSTV